MSDMDYFEFENWLNSPVEWNAKHEKSKMRLRLPDYDTHRTYTLKLKNWQLTLLSRALVGRLKDEDDELVAKRLGYHIMKQRWGTQKWQMDYAEKMGDIVDEELKDMKDDFDELQERVWKETACLTGNSEVEIEVEEAE